MVKCALVPLNTRLATDLALPPNSSVKKSVAARLRQRAHRDRLKHSEGNSRDLVQFPWNPASRAKSDSLPFTFRRTSEKDRGNCVLCGVINSRDCFCGATFAKETDLSQLTSVIRFLRAPTTAVYVEDDPADQDALCTQIGDLIDKLQTQGDPVNLVRKVIVFAAIAGLSGRPEVTMKLGKTIGSSDDVALLAFLSELCATEIFFRGGQAHGSLKKSAVPDAVKLFIDEHLDTLQIHVIAWAVSQTPAAATDAVRCTLRHLRTCAWPVFGAGDYWIKRTVEIIILAGVARPIALHFRAEHVDGCMDLWPLASGTRAALQRVFPSLRQQNDLRQGLRVIQRALGAGQRRVCLLRVSAFLCFWKRAIDGSICWPVPFRL